MFASTGGSTTTVQQVSSGRQESIDRRSHRACRMRCGRGRGTQSRSQRHSSLYPGRMDASQEQTDLNTFDVLEPVGDAFRNYLRADDWLSPETRLLDRANLLKLTAPQMTALIGGMRALNANHEQSKLGVFTDRPET